MPHISSTHTELDRTVKIDGRQTNDHISKGPLEE